MLPCDKNARSGRAGRSSAQLQQVRCSNWTVQITAAAQRQRDWRPGFGPCTEFFSHHTSWGPHLASSGSRVILITHLYLAVWRGMTALLSLRVYAFTGGWLNTATILSSAFTTVPILLLRRDRLRGPPSLLYNGYRGALCAGVKAGRGVMLTTHPLLVQRLRKSRSCTSSHPNAPVWSVTGPFYLLPFTNTTLTMTN
jgi:hypothetical protein